MLEHTHTTTRGTDRLHLITRHGDHAVYYLTFETQRHAVDRASHHAAPTFATTYNSPHSVAPRNQHIHTAAAAAASPFCSLNHSVRYGVSLWGIAGWYTTSVWVTMNLSRVRGGEPVKLPPATGDANVEDRPRVW